MTPGVVPTHVDREMVFIKDILEKKRTEECESIRRRLIEKSEKLTSLYMETNSLRKLQSIETSVDHLIEEKPTPRVKDVQRREEKRKYYEKNKEAILSRQSKRWEEARVLAREETKRAKKDTYKPRGAWDQFQDKVIDNQVGIKEGTEKNHVHDRTEPGP